MNEETYWMMKAMEEYGGSFVQSLSVAFRYADDNNFLKLSNAFPEYVKEYTELGLKLKDVRSRT